MNRFILCYILMCFFVNAFAQKEKTENLDSIIVQASTVRAVKRTQISAVSLPASVIMAMPATMGEPDVLKSLQMIPGVVGAGVFGAVNRSEEIRFYFEK